MVVQNDNDTDAKLLGFVTLCTNSELPVPSGGKIDEKEEVNAWAEIRKAIIYADVNSIDISRLGRDFMGWKSMYDGRDIDRMEMEEWLADTLQTFLDGKDHGHVLEIGTGTGMILFNLGPKLQSYVGFEPVESVANFVQDMATSIPHLADKVMIKVGTATDIHTVKGSISPTTVVVNSVAQYFPSPEYLEKVVVDLLELATTEYIFFGDIRSYALYPQFQLTMAIHHFGKIPEKEQVQQYMEELGQSEKELLIDPAFFTSLRFKYPHLVAHVEIIPKRMKATNELSCYRYAAVLHTNRQGKKPLLVHEISEVAWMDFIDHEMNAHTLLQQLRQASSSSVVAISNIPHSKTFLERTTLNSFYNDVQMDLKLDPQCSKKSICSEPLSVCELFSIAEEAGFKVEISWARQFSQQGGFDAVFHHLSGEVPGSRILFQFPTDHENRSFSSLTNRPLQTRLNRQMEKLLQESLQVSLPSYMLPTAIRIIDKMPLNQNKKIDRQVLAQYTAIKAPNQNSSRVAPRNDIEHVLCEEFATIIGVDFGITDNFFKLGGHSLMATRVISRINKRLQIGVTVKDIFDCPTAEGLSQRIEPLLGSTQYITISKYQHSGPTEQSFAQGRLWFLDQLYPNSVWYLMVNA